MQAGAGVAGWLAGLLCERESWQNLRAAGGALDNTSPREVAWVSGMCVLAFSFSSWSLPIVSSLRAAS